MRTFVLFALVIICSLSANGQKQTPADPFGLTAFGFGEKLESRPLITPSNEPAQSRACGTGVYLKEETVTVNNKAKKIKVVIVYFLPNPSTLSTFDDAKDRDQMKPAPAQEPTSLPPGVSSLTFFWPPQLRNPQRILFMRAEKVNSGLIARSLDFVAELDVQEGNSSSILWKFDHEFPGIRSPELLGNRISSDPLLLKMSFPRGTKKCIEAK
jgi:hypothetical protein